MLLGSLSAETVRWSQALDTLRASKSGEIELVFKDGTVDCFDLVVGADGAWSRVRPFLSPAQPRYTGLTFFELEIRHIERRHPGVAMLVSHSLLIAGADRKTIFAQRNSSGHVRVYVALRCDAIDAAMDDRRSMVAPQTRQQLARQFDGWNAGLVELIEIAEDDVRPWPIHILPVGHQWPTGVGVTLLGDAAHLMAPAGDGANLTMRDAVDLASAIADAEDWRRGIVAYEVGMHSRAEVAARNAVRVLVEGTLEDNIDLMNRRCRTNDRAGRAQAVPAIVKLTSADYLSMVANKRPSSRPELSRPSASPFRKRTRSGVPAGRCRRRRHTAGRVPGHSRRTSRATHAIQIRLAGSAHA